MRSNWEGQRAMGRGRGGSLQESRVGMRQESRAMCNSVGTTRVSRRSGNVTESFGIKVLLVVCCLVGGIQGLDAPSVTYTVIHILCM